MKPRLQLTPEQRKVVNDAADLFDQEALRDAFLLRVGDKLACHDVPSNDLVADTIEHVLQSLGCEL